MAGALLLAGGGVFTLPRGIEAVELLAAADSPERLVELGLDRHLDAARAGREIEDALAGGDAELAVSMLALADERKLAIEPRLRAKVDAAAGIAATALRTTGKFVDGFVVGAPDDIASLAGTMTGDLLIYGDVRDVVRETSHLVRGQEADELVLGLACVGLAITAGTYATLGAGAPARAGVSGMKAASKTGRLSARLAGAMMRPLREAVDTAALKGAVTPVLLMQ
ncbi:MAG: hypothetical protein IT538_12860, partial [Variibacter sp.]|nr:hypothetical protein [Variibacter sp.]